MLEIDFAPAIRTVTLKFERLARSFRSFREPLSRAAKSVVNLDIAQGFLTGRPEWEPLDLDTVANKGHAAILVDSGRMARSASAQARWRFDRNSAAYDVSTFPASSRYARFHHFGTQTMPSRQFALLEFDAERKIGNVFDRWTAEKIRESGLK